MNETPTIKNQFSYDDVVLRPHLLRRFSLEITNVSKRARRETNANHLFLQCEKYIKYCEQKHELG